MKKLLILVLMISSISLFAQRDRFTGEEVKLGVGLGLSHADYEHIDESNQIVWGFYVDIPVISTLTLTPSSMVYKLDFDGKTLAATDIDLGIKFNIPLNRLVVYLQANGGLTQAQFSNEDGLSLNVGGGVGVGFKLVSNISAFAELNGRIIVRDDGNIKHYMGIAGLMWSF